MGRVVKWNREARGNYVHWKGSGDMYWTATSRISAGSVRGMQKPENILRWYMERILGDLGGDG